MQSIQERVETGFRTSFETLVKGCSSPLTVVCALSGGPDSTALLYLLNHLKTKIPFSLAAAYVDHGIRSDAERSEEALHVERLCDDLTVPLYTKRLSPGFLESYARLKGCGVEAAARTYRYHFFDRVRSRLNSSPEAGGDILFALGHNRNDQCETFLMRLFGASSLEGLKGIPRKRGPYIRPLMNTSRQDIEAYLDAEGIRGVTDQSNLKDDYLRNKVRLDLIPAIEGVFPAAGASLLSFQDDFREVLQHYSTLVQESCPWVPSVDGGSLCCKGEDFERLPFVSRKAVLLGQINRLQKGLIPPDRRIPSSFFSPLETLKSGVILKGHGILLENRQGTLYLSRQSASGEIVSTFYHLDSDHPWDRGAYILALCPADRVLPDDDILFEIPENRLEPLVIRDVAASREKKLFPSAKKEDSLVLYHGGMPLCLLQKESVCPAKGINIKKISPNHRDRDAQCVIIRGRGAYAPGRKRK
ncbi:MAG: tRNA lysidine(34) synthetase TilS [Spirochaetales bacterium]|nr:tRNA lysidine(34) synthetase TilS [Spirochaetales bacterium]